MPLKLSDAVPKTLLETPSSVPTPERAHRSCPCWPPRARVLAAVSVFQPPTDSTRRIDARLCLRVRSGARGSF